MSKNILITGGAGFLGSHLADALIVRGHHVRLFDNFTPQVHNDRVPDYLNPNAELFRGDVNDRSALVAALAGVDVVFHLAAAVGVGQSMYQIAHYINANTQGTATLLQALLDLGLPVEKLIVASSMSIYGEGNYLCVNCGTIAPAPRSVEQLARQDWEAKCPQCNASLTPLPTTEAKALQCTSIYALSKKDQEEMCLLYRRAPLIFEDGRQMRDFVSVHDAAQACVLAMETHSADGMGLNIGCGTPISIREVAQALSAALEVDSSAEITGKYRAGDIRHCFADISAARAHLGYEPRISFENGMKELVHWLRSQQFSDQAHAAVQELERYGLTA